MHMALAPPPLPRYRRRQSSETSPLNVNERVARHHHRHRSVVFLWCRRRLPFRSTTATVSRECACARTFFVRSAVPEDRILWPPSVRTLIYLRCRRGRRPLLIIFIIGLIRLFLSLFCFGFFFPPRIDKPKSTVSFITENRWLGENGRYARCNAF